MGNPEATAQERSEVFKLAFGAMAAQVLTTAAELRLADLFGDGERTAAELAEGAQVHAEALNRLLRAMAGLGLLAENRPGTFALTGAGALLRTDRPDSMHGFIRAFGDPTMQRAWERLDFSVRTGQTAFDEVFGTDFFSYLGANDELSVQFNVAMSQATQQTAAVLPGSFGFGRFGSVADIGGGDGTLIAAILREHPQLRGILFDSEQGIAEAADNLRRQGVADRCELRTGDFFSAVPAGADLYLIKSVLHDWDDERAGAILRHCRQVIPDHGRLLIIEPVLPEQVDGSITELMYLSDLNMLVNLGGRERTRADFEQLCRRADFLVTNISTLPGQTSFCLIEAEPA